MANKSEIFDRAYGCFLGQAIGDALGTRYEFKNARVTKSAIKHDLETEKSSFLPILGGGPFAMERGQVTDDTEMAMGLARSLQRCRIFDITDIAKSYAVWSYSNPPDIGLTTRRAFDGLPRRRQEMESLSVDAVFRSILESSKQHNKESLSNGSLMRISSLAIAGTDWPLDTLRSAAISDCRLTHPNSDVHDAVAAYVTAIWYLINTGDRQKAYSETVSRVQTSRLRGLLEISDNPAVPVVARNDDGSESVRWIDGDSTHMGYFGVALKWAFSALRAWEKTFEAALVDVISRGGDTDTNGCVTGALLGAAVGASNIPEAWKSVVLSAKPRRLETYSWAKMDDAESLVNDLLTVPAPTEHFSS